jgi:hypothetical protein
MSLDFSSLLTKAWKMTWKNKVLWIFSFLTALGGGGWGGSGGCGGGFPSIKIDLPFPSERYISDLPPQSRQVYEQLASVN